MHSTHPSLDPTPAASYKYRRDYAAVAHAPHALRRLQPLPQRDAERGAFASRLRGGGWLEAALDPPAMQQAIAWELALRDMREAEVGAPGEVERHRAAVPWVAVGDGRGAAGMAGGLARAGQQRRWSPAQLRPTLPALLHCI